jgi:hypothetical protein
VMPVMSAFFIALVFKVLIKRVQGFKGPRGRVKGKRLNVQRSFKRRSQEPEGKSSW